MKEFWNKTRRKWMKLRLQPIRVLCFHEIGQFCEGSPDWVPTSFLLETLMRLQQEGYTFITLTEAYRHLKKDVFRCRKYAVLTADDGLKCQLEILPCLRERNIPITLFLNVTSVQQIRCGLPYRKWYHMNDSELETKYAKEIYISEEDLCRLDSSLVSVSLHGYNHDEAANEISLEEFKEDVKKSLSEFERYANFAPFYAYKYGRHSSATDDIVRKNQLVPVLTDGAVNYTYDGAIHRETIELCYRKKVK